VNPLLALWRRLDRELIRNHVELWILQVHRLCAAVLVVTAVLALVVFLLPWYNLLSAVQELRLLSTMLLGLFLVVLPLLLRREEQPFVRRSHWPQVLSVWLCMIIASAPLLLLPRMIQARVREQVLHRHDADRWSALLQSSSSDMPSWGQHCRRAIAPPGGYPTDEDERICSLLSPTLLVPFMLEQRRTDWLSILLLLLLLSLRSLLLVSSRGESLLETVAVISAGMFAPVVGYLFVAIPLRDSTTSIASATLAVLILGLLHPVASAQRITPALTLSWSVIHTGIPLLAILGSTLLNPREVHYQVLYLGLVLLLTFWLQKTYDRLRALPS
jgi:hypothetical protein